MVKSQLFNADNIAVMRGLIGQGVEVDLVYADMLYDCFDFGWIDYCYELLKDTGSIFIQTDFRSIAELKFYLDKLFGKSNFVNWIIWPYDWGGRSPRRFARKHDDILWYSKTKEYKFYPERVAIPKVMTDPSMNPSGRTTKIPTDVWSDIGNFHTMSKERVKTEDGKNIQWQKPLNLMNRIILSTTDKNDLVFDPFMGSGSTVISALQNNRRVIGAELDTDVFKLAVKRLDSYLTDYEKNNTNTADDSNHYAYQLAELGEADRAIPFYREDRDSYKRSNK